ncbi:MAG: hypothetical protein ABI471_09290 [Sphingomonas bacterium]
MAHMLKLYLITTGIGAFIAVTFPAIVVIGLFLIVPGLILSLMPTAFLYGCVFAALWFPLQSWLGPWAATLLALPATIGLLYLVAIPSHLASRAKLAEAILPDVTPGEKLGIAGHMRLDMPAFTTEPFDPANPKAPRPVRCNALCAAMLFTPGVESVTLNPNRNRTSSQGAAIGDAPLDPSARTFRRVPRAQCAETLRPTDAAGLGLDHDGVRALETEWNLRLSSSDCIIAVPTLGLHDLVVAQGNYSLFGDRVGGKEWSLGARAVRVERFEIRSADGTVRMRSLIATTEALTRPLLITPGGSLENFSFGWSHTTLSNANRYATLDMAKLLKAHTNLVLSADPVATARLARGRLQAMVDDPAVTTADTGWSAAEGYFAQLRKTGIDEADRRLLPALIRDPRMTRFQGIWDAVRAHGDQGTILREAMVERLARPPADPEAEADREARRTIGRVIASLPPGTFASPSPAELSILGDPTVRSRAPGLVARQSDRGATAVPLLLDIIEYHSRAWMESRNDRSRRPEPGDNRDAVMVDAARVAFCRLGLVAASALPRLIALDRERQASNILSGDREWTTTLARLGQPVESFAKPENLSGTTEQFHADLRRRLTNFQPDRDCRSTFM